MALRYNTILDTFLKLCECILPFELNYQRELNITRIRW